MELCTSTLSPEGNAQEPGCLAGEEGPRSLGRKISWQGSAGKCCIMPSPPLNQSDLFTVARRWCLTILLKKNLSFFVIIGPEQSWGFYIIAGFFPCLKKEVQVLLS